jgi:Uma2 family endonuclease
MSAVTTLPRGRAFTRADLERMPDDGHRYELIDGSLVVTPAPSPPHQVIVLNLAIALKAACPDDLRVLTAPLDVALAPDTVVQPDLLVARRADFTERDLPTAPLLAVEVLSPSTRRIDLTLKRSRFEAAGCPSYWVVDPEGPSITTWELRNGVYVESASAARDEELEVCAPYPLTIVPARLMD